MLGRRFGHYEIVELLGQGGMGTVYLARDLHLDRPVALKLLRSDRTADPGRCRRFVQEAKAASALNHPNIVHVYDIDRDGDVQYIAMEFVAGETVAARLKNGALPVQEAVPPLIQIADALSAAHRAGIAHRDLKPENIVIAPSGMAKVLDFGVAKLVDDANFSAAPDDVERGSETVTMATGVVGTPAYMSPEQAAGYAVDGRSDIFSLGCVAYEMSHRNLRGHARVLRCRSARVLFA